jgi:predicted P-loop ATPase
MRSSELGSQYRDGANIGVRPGANSKTPSGYLHLIDLDIRDESKSDAAMSKLRELVPNLDSLPTVISGSGGASRHFYFFTSEPFRSKKLAKSSTFQMVWDAKKERDVKKNDWEIELFGTGKQAVLPPSIHPDTGKPYAWIKPLSLDEITLGISPTIPASDVVSWGARSDAESSGSEEDEDDFLMDAVLTRKLDLEETEVAKTLADLPDDWPDDRDRWLTVGQALHHEFDGSDEGLDYWCEWSKQSEKYDGRDQRRVWRSFKSSRTPVRMATLIHAANANRMAALAHFEDDDAPTDKPAADPLDALLGPQSNSTLSGDVLDPLESLLGNAPKAEPTNTMDGPPTGSPVERGSAMKNWLELLQYSEDGGIKNTLHNIELIVRNDPRFRGIVGLNEFTQLTHLVNQPGEFRLAKESPKPTRQLQGPLWDLADHVNGDDWTDDHEHPIRTILEAPKRQGGYGISNVSTRNITAAISIAANEHRYHPVKDYLLGCYAKWDGQKRADRLFIDYLGSPDNSYYREAAVLMCLGAVTRIFEPGHKFDFVVILEGAQGKKKSTFINILGHKWSHELDVNFEDTNRLIESMKGGWILEIPELQGFSRAEVTSLKATLSKTHDRGRLAYQHNPKRFARQCIFVGSTNESEYLRDETGGRRFWPVEVRLKGDIDTDKLAEHIDQIWGEVVAMYYELRKAKPYGTLPLYMRNAEAARIAEFMQESRRRLTLEDDQAGQIAAWLETRIDPEFEELDGQPPRYRNTICGLEVWVELYKRDASSYGARERASINKALGKIPGWECGGRVYVPKWGQQRVRKRIEPK